MTPNSFEGRDDGESWRVPELEGWRHDPDAQADDELMDYLGVEVDEAVSPVIAERDIRFLAEQDGRTVRVDLALLFSQSDGSGAVQPLPPPLRAYPLGAPRRSEPLGVEELDHR